MGVNSTNLRSDINFALLKYDTNHDGKLTAKEFVTAVKKIDKDGYNLNIKQSKELVGDIEFPMGSETPEISMNDVKAINNLCKKASNMNPNTVIFQITKDKEKQFNLADCKKVVDLTNKDITYVADRSNSLKEIGKSIISIPFVALERIENGRPTGNLEMGEIHQKAKIAKKHKSGNCTEMACVAFVHAQEMGAKKVELFSVENHLFVATNRKIDSNINDPRTWGDQCMIIDPWSKTSFPASEYFVHKQMKGQTPFFEGPVIPNGNGVYG